MDFAIRPYRPGEEKYVADAHRRIYSEEYGWGDASITYAMHLPLEFARQDKNAREELWVADAGGKPVGCIMLCQTEEETVGQLRLFLVEKDYRRCGVGSALTGTLLKRAREVGYQRLILWTAGPLSDAVAHYEKLGFRAVEETENTTWRPDGGVVREIKMELTL